MLMRLAVLNLVAMVKFLELVVVIIIVSSLAIIVIQRPISHFGKKL